MLAKKKVFLLINLTTFLMFISLPTLLINANDNVDVSRIFSVAEEENKETKKDLVAKFLSITKSIRTYLLLPILCVYSAFCTNNYSIPLLSKSAPPPRF